MGEELTLKPDEIEYLGNLECAECGHLESLHNFHCCPFCMVTGCKCEQDGLATRIRDE